MRIQDMLFRLGVSTWVQDIITVLPAVAVNAQQVGKNLSTDVGLIYGLSTYADGVDSMNNALPSTAQCHQLYLRLKSGGTQFGEDMMMSDFLNEFAGSPLIRQEKFTPFIIPRFDLSSSQYLNPAAFVSIAIHLKLWYVNTADWARIKDLEMFKHHSKPHG